MKEDQTRWNEKYSKNDFPLEPSKIVLENYHLAQMGSALDIGSGAGRNAIFLSKMGFKTRAVDISDIALNNIKEKSPKTITEQVDLDNYNLKENSYDLIINISFLLRRLFPGIIKALRKNGILIFQTFLESPHLFNNNNQFVNNSFYLKSNELLEAFFDLQIVLYEEKGVINPVENEKNLATLIARKI